jgi:hypothetical protein
MHTRAPSTRSHQRTVPVPANLYLKKISLKKIRPHMFSALALDIGMLTEPDW